MKLHLPSLALTLAMPLACAADDSGASVRFSNNDRISGSMESLTTERLVWNSPILEKPVPFFIKNVLDLTLVPKQQDASHRHEATITLTNGDIIRGQLVSVADDIVELDTWFAGHMKFNRLMIRDVRISERPDFIYQGPTGLDGWQQSGEKPAWTYQNSGFRSSAPGSIARNVNLPDECSVAFDAEWRGSLGLKLVFFSDDLATDHPTTGYEMTIQTRSVYLRSCKTQKFLGHTPNAVTLQENEKARIEVRTSLKSGKICLFVDGQIIDVWTDPDVVLSEMGRGIHFISQNESPIRISRIEVGTWDGDVEELPTPRIPGGMPRFGNLGIQEMEDEDEEPATPEKKPDSQRMELRNGDTITGEVLSIEDGKITVKTPFREIKLPIEALRSIALKPVDLERCKRENGDVRAWLPDGSSLVFKLQAVNGDSLSGTSQNFGAADFNIAAFSRIEFNIYNPDFEEIRATDGL